MGPSSLGTSFLPHFPQWSGRRAAYVFLVVIIVLGCRAARDKPISGTGVAAPAAEPDFGATPASLDRGPRWTAHAACFAYVSHESRRRTGQLQTADSRRPTGSEQLSPRALSVVEFLFYLFLDRWQLGVLQGSTRRPMYDMLNIWVSIRDGEHSVGFALVKNSLFLLSLDCLRLPHSIHVQTWKIRRTQ